MNVMLWKSRFCYERLTNIELVIFLVLINTGHCQSLLRADGLCESLQNSAKLIFFLFAIIRISLSVQGCAIFTLFTPCWPSHNGPASPMEPLCQPIIHVILMSRCQHYCPSDIMPEDWCIDLLRLIRAGMIQQHYMIYSVSNIWCQGRPLGPGCLSTVLSSSIQVGV